MPGGYQGGRKSIPSRPGKGGDLYGSSAVQDLGVQSDTAQRTQDELTEMKRRKKLMGGGAGPLGSAAVMSLTGNQY